MADETEAKRGDAAWKEERDAISRRNADAHKRAQTEQRSRDTRAAASVREEWDQEADRLRKLNDRIAKQQSRSTS